MKRVTLIAAVLLLFSGTASAQLGLGQGGVLGELLGTSPDDVVGSLIASLQAGNLKPTIDALAGNGSESLLEGAAAQNLNKALVGLLGPLPPEPQAVVEGLLGVVEGLLNGLGRGLLGGGLLGGSNGGLLGGGLPLVGGLLGGSNGGGLLGGLLGGGANGGLLGGLPLVGGLLGGGANGGLLGGLPLVGGLLGGSNGGGLLGGLLGAKNGGGLLGGLLGSGLLGGGTLSAAGQGLALSEIPLDNIDPATATALLNNVTLPGL